MTAIVESEVRRKGADKPEPFLVVVLNNPVLERRYQSGRFDADPLDPDDGRYTRAIDHIEAALWGELPGQRESAFIDGSLAQAARLEVLTIRDAPTDAAHAFVSHYGHTMITPRWQAVHDFFKATGRTADVIFAVTGSTTQNRATAWPGADDRHRGHDLFEVGVDGQMDRFRHHYWPTIPGTVAVHVDERSITPVHEFGHAIATYNAKDHVSGQAVDGLIADLYNDGVAGLNKRTGRPPDPLRFATYVSGGQTTDHDWDRVRLYDGWRSYHCSRMDPTLPAIMDNYTNAPSDMQTACLHDSITRQFIRDRVAARMKR